MSTARRAFFVLCSMGLLAGISGCFTEVGNPEDETPMTASFQMDYTRDSTGTYLPDSVSILRFRLAFQTAEYRDTDSAQGVLWQDSKGRAVDFTGTDPQAGLPLQTLTAKPLATLEMDFGFSPGKNVRADTLNFNTFQSDGYIKGIYYAHGSPVNFLFALPDTAEGLTLNYSQASLQGWRQDGAYHCEFSFLASHWLSQVNLSQAMADTDKTGRSLVLFDAGHNPLLYSALTKRFYGSFNTQQVYWDTTSSSP